MQSADDGGWGFGRGQHADPGRGFFKAGEAYFGHGGRIGKLGQAFGGAHGQHLHALRSHLVGQADDGVEHKVHPARDDFK